MRESDPTLEFQSSLVSAQTFVNQIHRSHALVRPFLYTAKTFKFLPDRSVQVATACDNIVLHGQQFEVEIDNN
jgi:hypothetical protein